MEQRTHNGRGLVIGLVAVIGVVVVWAAYLLFVVGQK